MRYLTIVVDDELPSLRYLQNIVEKYAPSFQVVQAFSNAETALEYLKTHPVDLLITDISMNGMNGIELANQVRALIANICIVIVSGYSEFEYAQGAIQAAVDAYILKPVSISQMRDVLEKLKNKLDAVYHHKLSALLPAVACDWPYDKKELLALFRQTNFYFALARMGNLNHALSRTLTSTSLTPSQGEKLLLLRGRDEDEAILIYPDEGLEGFMAAISIYMSQLPQLSCWTVVYQAQPFPLTTLHDFITRAIAQLQRQAVIGCKKMYALQLSPKVSSPQRFPSAKVKQLLYFATSGKTQNLKDYFMLIASEWERTQLPQQQAHTYVLQITSQLAAVMPALSDRLDAVYQEIDDLFLCASSYGELLASIYSVLFTENSFKNKKMSTRELYDYAVQYIDENYAHPLSMQSVCEKIGISQTYLSRLFRKYSDTTFNAYLTRRRIEAALKLLQEHPDFLLRDIAACVGYEDASYFSKVFHQYTGFSPSQYTNKTDHEE